MSNTNESLWSKKHLVSYSFAHFFISALGQSFLLGMYAPYVCEEFGITQANYGLYYSFVCIASGFSLPFVGSFIDKFKMRYVSLTAALMLALFCATLSFVPNVLLFFMALYGVRFIGQALMPLIGATGVARYFKVNRGKAIAFAALGLSLSEILLSNFFIEFIENYGWRDSWIALSLFVLVVFIPLIFLLVKGTSSFHLAPADDGTIVSQSRREVIRNPKFYVLLLNYVLSPFVMTGYFMIKGVIGDLKGWDIVFLTKTIAIFGIARVATNFISGPLIDRFSGKSVFPFTNIPLLIGTALMVYTNDSNMVYVYMTLYGISVSFVSASATAMWAEIYGGKNLGSIKSVTTMAMVLSTAMGSGVLGTLLHHTQSLQQVYIPILLLGVLLAVITMIMTKRMNY